MTQPPSQPGKRRRVLLWVAVAWGVVVAGLAFWAVGHGPATVAEQRTAGQAQPVFRAAVGNLFAAAGGPGRAVVLGALRVETGCRVTSVRHGVSLFRDVTVYVRAGEQRAAVEAIAAALPASYRAQVTASQGGTHYSLHADAGSFIGIDLDADVGDAALTLEVSSGCRPVGAGGVDRGDPSAGPPPAALQAALTLLGAPGAATSARAPGTASPGGSGAGPAGAQGTASPGGSGAGPAGAQGTASPGGSGAGPAGAPGTASPGAPGAGSTGGPGGSGPVTGGSAGPSSGSAAGGGGVTVQAVECPGGGTAATYTVGGVTAPGDWRKRLGTVASGAAVVRSDSSRWAYRAGGDSVVVVNDGTGLRVSATTSC